MNFDKTHLLFDVGDQVQISKPKIEIDSKNSLVCAVEMDEILLKACEPFDYKFEGVSKFELPKFDAPKKDKSWNIGLIVGSSGSGKSQLLKKHFGTVVDPEWNPKKAIVSHFLSHDDAMSRLSAVGLNSVPSWCRPYHVLSNGEQFRAKAARILEHDAIFDEWTSVVDRTVAKACSHAIQRYIRKYNIYHVVFATCHYDIVEWLDPDWVFDTSTAALLPRGSLQRRKPMQISIEPCDRSWWGFFKHYHYLSNDLNLASQCYLAKIDNTPVAFCAAISMPHNIIRNAYREHRLVVLPDYQGFGIGRKFSEWVGEQMIKKGKRFFAVTVHYGLGKYRNSSSKWKKTRSNGRFINKSENGNYLIPKLNKTQRNGFRYSHEYIGNLETKT